VQQPDGALLAIRIEPAGGGLFPFWSECGQFTGQSLSASYANFPNPFAAGRENTTFVFNLPREGTVNLKIITPRGETIKTVIDNEQRSGELHQDDAWDGRNGKGDAVRNGVYIAELSVHYTDGEQERILRKVAVVR
jgi:hypothetical protein